ncbi:hypothetical protein [Streptomyces fagopyri]|uniref:hypothetical protein n=1 Tax=Streptomyces fagopyri TaxID=2662397 RepID=UPI001D1770D9|nr:hypothetical protein [Streptomyces fagopyri]
MTGSTAVDWTWETAEDPDEVHALLRACDAYQARRYGSPAPVRNTGTTERRVRSGEVHLLRHDGEVAGMFTLSWDPPFTLAADAFPPAVRPAYLGRLAVAPRLLADSAPTGATCVRRAAELASARGADALRSEANPDLAGTVKLLELLGFRRHGDVLTDAAGRRTVRLQKSFGPGPAARSEESR